MLGKLLGSIAAYSIIAFIVIVPLAAAAWGLVGFVYAVRALAGVLS